MAFFVLILVVMEYTQWGKANLDMSLSGKVLILVVMEYTQWECDFQCRKMGKKVLILVVMEYTQWAFSRKVKWKILISLNPCCNGIYSMSLRLTGSTSL